MSIVELRQYTLKPGKRDALIALFEREFVESQEEVGMDLIGQFRDADDADRFVWLRGFADMASRAQSLAAFYGGPAWKAHREEANATMIDSDNVLLLRPAWEGSGFVTDGGRPPRGAPETAKGALLAQIHHFATPVTDSWIGAFREAMPTRFQESGAMQLAVFETEGAKNSFPALPVREGENVAVAFALFADEKTAARAASACSLPPDLARQLAKPVDLLRLRPTPRSRLCA